MIDFYETNNQQIKGNELSNFKRITVIKNSIGSKTKITLK